MSDGLSKELDSIRKRLRDGGIRWAGAAPSAREVVNSGISACCQVLSGGATFMAGLTLSQAFQGAILRVSSSSPFGLPSMLGFVTVAAASVAALGVADSVSDLFHLEEGSLLPRVMVPVVVPDEVYSNTFSKPHPLSLGVPCCPGWWWCQVR
ncbi:unnamed protein product [Discosporangium mesarthrocarpum]